MLATPARPKLHPSAHFASADLSAWLQSLEGNPPARGFGVSVLKSALAQLAAPTLTFKPSIDKSAMSSTAVLTTINPDRQGDVIDPTGGDFSEHQTNPIVMFHHGKAGHKLPLGKAEDRNGNYTVRLVKAQDGSDVLVGTTHFSQSSRFAQDVFGLVAEDILRGVSIGFDPLPDEDSVDELGPSPTLKRPALHFKGWKLLEYSHTPLGVNRDALTVAVTKAIENPRLMHPTLLKYLAPMAEKSSRTTVTRGGAAVRKAMDEDDDATGDETQDEGQDAGGDAGADAGGDAGFDPTSDDPSADPALKDSGYGNAAPEDDGPPPPTVQTLMDGSQGILDLCSAIEASIKKGEHMGGRKFAAKLCADLRASAAEAKQYADKVKGELSGAPMDSDQGSDATGEDDGDETGDTDDTGDDSEAPAPAPETDDEGAIVTKGYACRRWTFADLAGQRATAAKETPDTARKFKAMQLENDKLKRALAGLLEDAEAGARRRA